MISILESKIIKTYEKGPIRRSLFSNGAVSLFHQFKGMRSAVVNLYFLAGSIFEQEHEHGLAHVIEHMLFKERDNGQLLRELEVHGAQVNAYTYKEYVCFEMDCPAEKLEKFLPLFLKLFFSPQFCASDLAIEKRVIVQEIKEDKDDHEIEGLEILFERNFERPLGHRITGKIKNVLKFSVADLERYFFKNFSADRMILSVVSGKSHPRLENVFRQAMPQRMLAPKRIFRLTPSKKLGKIQHFSSHLARKSENCTIYYSLDGPTFEHKNYFDLLVLDELLFEGMTSKFFLLLREQLGIIYGLGSSINAFAKNGSYVMVFNTQKKYLEILDREVKKLFTYFQENPLQDEQIAATKARIIDGVDMSFDNMSERCEFIALEEIYGTMDFSKKFLKDKMANVDEKSIMLLIKKMMKRGMTRLVLGPK